MKWVFRITAVSASGMQMTYDMDARIAMLRAFAWVPPSVDDAVAFMNHEAITVFREICQQCGVSSEGLAITGYVLQPEENQ